MCSQKEETISDLLYHTLYPRTDVFSRSTRYSEAQPEQVEAKHRSG